MRVLLEDPRQLLSGCVTDFAVKSLYEVDNDPSKVVVPGLSGITYPTVVMDGTQNDAGPPESVFLQRLRAGQLTLMMLIHGSRTPEVVHIANQRVITVS